MTRDLSQHRSAEHEIDPLLLNRWSPRALSGESISREELMTLFEAARWAPSSYNNQPWRFLYATRDGEHWPLFLDLLVDFNQRWAGDAAVLMVVVAKKTFDSGKPSITHSYDAGAAWENLALQASRMGLVAHGMEGFDYEKARRVLDIPDDFEVKAMAAIGRPGSKEELPKEIQEMEQPSGRKALSELVFDGKFPRRG